MSGERESSPGNNDLVKRLTECYVKPPSERRSDRGLTHLPPWPEQVRAVPNCFLRAALFGAIAKGARRFLKGARIAAPEGIEIHYTGERLDQGDLDVWASVLHVLRLQAMGEQCRVRSYSLLKLMGKTDTGKNRATLHERITRLRASAIEIKHGRKVYIGGLIDDASKDEDTQEWVIVLSPRLRALFAADQFTHVEWAVRRDLSGHQLAQWLHGFFASHAKPYPLKIETLHRLCGSEAVLISDFTKSLRKALGAVEAACEFHGQQFHYAIVGDLVHVKKTGSRTQRKHLARRRKKAS